MKLYALFLLFAGCLSTATVIASPEADCGCDFTLKPRAGETEIYVNGQTLGVQPGQKVCINGGTYYHVFLFNFFGTVDKPITITNCTGQVKVSGNPGYGFILNNSRYIHVTGSGDPSVNYGFLIDGTVAQQSVGFAMGDHTTDVELDHIEINKSGAGFIYASPPTCDPATWGSSFTIRNLSLHNNYVHDTGSEAFYIGSTSNTYNLSCSTGPVSVTPQVINGLKIYNNLIERSGWDGIQVASAPVGVEIYNNIIRQHGVFNRDSQQAGIILGGVSSGSVYNNLVLGGTGNSFQCFGVGLVKVYNNVFANGGYNGSAVGQSAVLIASRPTPAGYAKLTVQVINNTIVSPRGSGVVMYNEYAGIGSANVFANNLMVNPGALSISTTLGYYDVEIPAGDVTFLNNISKPTVAEVLFVDPANNNYNLNAGSVAIDAGLNVSGYGVTKDFNYNNRPSGAAFDVGAYEYITGTRVNQAPNVSAGSDQSITLPATQVTLSGSASDPDGSISLLNWKQQGGPVQSAIVSPSQASTLVTGLTTEGTYDFLLTATDNEGLTSTDVVRITVNPVVAPPPPPPTSGALKYRYYTFTGTWNNLPVLQSLTPAATGTVDNITLANRTQNDNFAYLWEGYIDIPVTGTYTFRTTSDDGSQFWIGDLPGPLVNNDGLHGPQDREGTITLNAGAYPIAVLFYEQGGGETMVLSWRTPQTGGSFVQVPASAYVAAPVTPPPPPPPPAAGPLKYRYYTYSGTWYNMPVLQSMNPTATGTVNDITLANRTQNDRFAYLWEGYINIPVSGSYTFRTTSDDGSQFWLGSYPGPIVYNDGIHGPQDREGTVTLNAGVYPIAVLYYEQEGGETMVLSWKTPQTGGAYVQVPSSAYVAAPVTPPTTSAGLNYKYYTYKGTWTALPDFSTLTPVSTGKVANVLITPKTQNDNFAFLWEGFITVPTTGSYTFRTNSDDGSKLYIGNYSYAANALVNNDGLHAGQDRDGTITLNAGTYPIAITFYEQDSREFINVYWKTPSSNTFVGIPDNVFTSSSSLQDGGSPLGEAISAFNSSSARKASEDEDLSASVKTGLTTIGANALSIFPNPAADRVNLQLTHAEKGAVQVSVINAQGIVLQNNRFEKGTAYWNQQVNVSKLKPGYYIIRVKGKTLDYKRSFIKK